MIPRGPEMGRAIVEKAREFAGKNYRNQGRGPHHYDCLGLPACVARELGLRSKTNGELLELYDRADYTPFDNGIILFRELKRHLHRVRNLKEARDGDLLVFTCDDVAHAAILSGGGRSMIHASATHQRVVEHVLGQDEQRVRAVFRFDEATG
jgi:hypothetical protein